VVWNLFKLEGHFKEEYSGEENITLMKAIIQPGDNYASQREYGGIY
jgi:hypothetical protein